MYTILNVYEKLRFNQPLSDDDCQQLLNPDSEIHDFQYSSLIVQILHVLEQSTSPLEHQLLQALATKFPNLQYTAYLTAPDAYIKWLSNTPTNTNTDSLYEQVLTKTAKGEHIGEQLITQVIERLLDKSLDMTFLACWFMQINYSSLTGDDLSHLTVAMKNSGATFDYRQMEALGNARIIRRYPTGALSEKISLIMPSVMAAAANSEKYDFNIASPFLVGRALSFTGGTWDKFKAIEGFEFPLPGEQTIQTMQACKIAMSVTIGDFNPADKLLYQFRSLTGTVPSHELILASIASKMLACPADHLLMDVRYGQGAFMPTLEKANRLGTDLCQVLNSNNAPASFFTVSTDEPTGCAIGHCFEVLEAVAIMHGAQTGEYDACWDKQGLDLQLNLVLKFFAGLMQSQYPQYNDDYWYTVGHELFASGEVFNNFIDLLRAHGVSDKTLVGIKSEPWQTLAPQTEPLAIISEQNGVLKSINQKQLGNLVNFKFGAGANEFGGDFSARSGVVLQKRIGQKVAKGEAICLVYFNQEFLQGADKALISKDFIECFEVNE